MKPSQLRVTKLLPSGRAARRLSPVDVPLTGRDSPCDQQGLPGREPIGDVGSHAHVTPPRAGRDALAPAGLQIGPAMQTT